MIAQSPVVQPIITRQETDRLRAMLSDPARRTYRPAEHLLSGGILRCGHCGQAMNSRSDKAQGRRYACIRHPGTAKCGRMTVVAEPVDRLVTAMLLEALEGVDLTPTDKGGRDAATTDALAAIAEDTALLDSLVVDYSDRVLSRSEWLTARGRVEQRIEQARAAVGGADRRAALTGLPTTGAALATAWTAMTLDRRRAVLRAVIDRVTVLPAQRPIRPVFDPARVVVEWRA